MLTREKYQQIGFLSSQFPSYVRHCCRSLYDGTSNSVLSAYRTVAMDSLRHNLKYEFCEEHLAMFELFPPEEVKSLIMANLPGKKVYTPCFATQNANGLPKKACLHCPRVGGIMMMIQQRGEKNGFGLGEK